MRCQPQVTGAAHAGALRFFLPVREALHISVLGFSWAIYNACWILLPSFGPDALVSQGWTLTAAQSATSLMMWASLLSLPLGGRLMEKFGYVTLSLSVFFILAALCILLLFLGVAPVAMFVLFGLTAGVPGGALLSLTSEAVTAGNRGPGLGVFYTWFYAVMAIAPAVAGWLRDVVGHPGAPLLLASALMIISVLGILLLRLLQARWPIAKAL